ncbi:hypothetical protein IAG25_40740 [Caballeronia sp. EK]|nr:hypothetical protein [Caballeronia sp. EK]
MIEAVRMVRGRQSMAAVAKILSISPKTLHHWVKADSAGKLPAFSVIALQRVEKRWTRLSTG